MMKAITVYPGIPDSMHLEEIPMPEVSDIPHGQGVLVKVLRVGVDGTDKEINAAEYGQGVTPLLVLARLYCEGTWVVIQTFKRPPECVTFSQVQRQKVV